MKPGIYQFEESGNLVWAKYQQGKLIAVNGAWVIHQREDGTPYCPETNLDLKFIMKTPSNFDIGEQLSKLGIVVDAESQTRDYNLVLIAAQRMMKQEEDFDWPNYCRDCGTPWIDCGCAKTFIEKRIKENLKNPEFREAFEEEIRESEQVITRSISQQLAEFWQPIETAPKDGTTILAYGWNLQDHAVSTIFWLELSEWDEWKGISIDHSCWVDDDSSQDQIDWVPTHWMPIPGKPKNT